MRKALSAVWSLVRWTPEVALFGFLIWMCVWSRQPPPPGERVSKGWTAQGRVPEEFFGPTPMDQDADWKEPSWDSSCWMTARPGPNLVVENRLTKLPVTGDTPDELLHSIFATMVQKGGVTPRERVLGFHKATFKHECRCKAAAGGGFRPDCSLELSSEIVLPEWEEHGDPLLVRKWRWTQRSTLAHETSHRAIFVAAGNAALFSLQLTRAPTCGQLERRVDEIMKSVVVDEGRRQEQFHRSLRGRRSCEESL